MNPSTSFDSPYSKFRNPNSQKYCKQRIEQINLLPFPGSLNLRRDKRKKGRKKTAEGELPRVFPSFELFQIAERGDVDALFPSVLSSFFFFPASWLSGSLLAMAPPYAARQRDQTLEKERKGGGGKGRRERKRERSREPGLRRERTKVHACWSFFKNKMAAAPEEQRRCRGQGRKG